MELMYASTRDANEKVTASQAILKGLANDGGLYVPTEIPSLDVSMEELSKMTYQETAYEVLKLFLTDYTEEELKTVLMLPMIVSLIQKRLHRWWMRMVRIILNCSMVRR